QLDGSQSKDPNKLALRYDTTFVTVPAGFTGSITNPTSSRPSFVPTVVGDYVVQLVVSDKDVSSAAVQVTITAAAKPPLAVLFDQTAKPGEIVILDASQSKGYSNGELTFVWTVLD